jgi:hypothetical protein
MTATGEQQQPRSGQPARRQIHLYFHVRFLSHCRRHARGTQS